jgi:hypothetical protein
MPAAFADPPPPLVIAVPTVPAEDPGEIDLSQFEEADQPSLETAEEERRPARQEPERADIDDDQEKGRPRKTKKKKKSPMSRHQLAMTSRGLGFHYAKLLTYMIALPVMIFSNLVVTFMFASGGRDIVGFFATVTMVASVCCGFVSPALGITGSTLCCRVPSRAGGKPLIIASLALDATAWVFPLVSILGARANPAFTGFGTTTDATQFALVLVTTAFVWTGASFILFILFLRKLPVLQDDVGMAGEAREIIGQYILLLIAAPIIVATVMAVVRYLSRDFASAYDFAGAVFAPQVEWVESREWTIGTTFVTVLGFWLGFVIKNLFGMLTLISSMRYALRARHGV